MSLSSKSSLPVSYAAVGVLSIAVTFSGVGFAASGGAATAPAHRHFATKHVAAAHATTVTPDTPAPEPAPAPVVKRVPAHKPWGHLLLAVPHHWVHPHDIKLPVRRLSKQFVHPRIVARDLKSLGYRRGVERAAFREAPRVVVIETAWKFKNADGALGWFDLYNASNTTGPHSPLHSAFHIRGVSEARGYLCRSRDRLGFSCGIAVARAGDLVLRVRFASLSPVTKVQVMHWLRLAAKQAGLHPHSSATTTTATTQLPA
jgi:hypothetical protein